VNELSNQSTTMTH